jgi:hypothetical protein
MIPAGSGFCICDEDLLYPTGKIARHQVISV